MNEREIFVAALQKSDAAERAAYLAEACSDDAALRERVESLLCEQDQLGSFLEARALAPGATVDRPPATEKPGIVIGPYKLLQQIGEGGMGVVWMAEQTQPVQRKVALKVIKPGMDSRQVIARFGAERQALAVMDHVNIARVLDAGTTESGLPYFVMELVHGVPITKYCDDNHLTPRQRLELFVPVCLAIQHAHQKGIIHRDIKPSNVMVTLYDGQPVPKVIDFGVAKATEQKLTERTLFTQFGTTVGTLEYMSPEQAETSALGVDTRSDIYSLGVLLYELLTGSTPLSRERIREAAFGEVLRIIREEEPPKPSTRLSDSGEALASISAQRKTDPAKLSKLMRGELDWIVMKCLEKDRGRRYETANGFAADIQRYLADEPVQACPPSKWYRFRKFARRNKRALATATLLGMMLLAAVGAVAGSLGWAVRDRAGRMAAIEHEATLALDVANRHQEQRHWAEALSAAKRADSLLAGDGSEELRRRVRELRRDLEMVIRLERIRDEVLSGAKSQVEHEDEKMFDIELADREYRRAFAEYGIDIDALPVEEAAHRLGARSVVTELAAALDSWALARSSLGKGDNSWKGLLAVAKAADPDEWRGRLRDAWEHKDLAALKALSVAEHVNRLPAHTLYLLGSVLREVGDVEGAVVFLRKAQQLHPDDFWINVQLALYYNRDIKPQQSDEMIRYATAANAIRKQSAVPYRYLGSALLGKGKLDEAIAANKEAIRLKSNYWAAYYNLGVALSQRGQMDEAITAYREASRLYPGWSWPHAALAEALSQKGSITEAEAEIREALRHGPNDATVLSMVAAAHTNLGVALIDQKKLDEAIACYKKAIELDPKLAAAHTNLGIALRKQGKLDEGIASHKKAIELDPKLAIAHYNLGFALREQGKLDEAIVSCKKAIELDPKLAAGHTTLGSALYGQGKVDEAIASHKRAIELDPKYAAAHSNLGNSLAGQGKLDEAIASYKKAIELDPKLAATHTNLGNALKDQGKLDEAIASHKKAIELDPKLAGAHSNLGNALEAQDKLDEAIACYRKAIELDPKYALAHTNLGSALARQGKLDEAIACFRKAIELDPKFAGAHCNLGMALDEKGQLDEAIACFRKAIELDPKFANAHNNLGKALDRQGNVDEAIACFRKAIELDPKRAMAHNNLGNALHGQGKLDEAIACYRKAIELDPQNAGAHNSLAWLLATCADPKFRDPKRALDLAKKAVELEPKNPQYWQTLGVAQYRAADWRAAIAALEKVKELGSPGDSTEWFPLAMAHWQLDEKVEARQWYNQAVQWMEKNRPQDDELKQFREEATELLGVKEK